MGMLVSFLCIVGDWTVIVLQAPKKRPLNTENKAVLKAGSIHNQHFFWSMYSLGGSCNVSPRLAKAIGMEGNSH